MQVQQRYVGTFIRGFLLICAAQYVLLQTDWTIIQYALTPWIEQIIHLNVVNPDNAITAMLLLCTGGFLLARALPAVRFAADVPTAADVPAETGSPSGVPRWSHLLQRYLLPLLVAAGLFGLLLYQLGLGNPEAWLVGVWLVVLAILVWVCFDYDRAGRVSLRLTIDRRDLLWMVALFVIGLVVCGIQLEQIPNSLVADEGSFWDRAYSIAREGEMRSFFDVGVYSYPLASSFYQTVILQIFGYSLWSWRFTSVLLTALTVFPLYLLVREMFNRRLAILSCLLMLTLPYTIAFARMGYNNAHSIFPVMLAVYLLYAGLRRRSAFYFCLAGIAAGLGFYTYTAGRLGGAVGGAFVVWWVFTLVVSRFRRGLSQERRRQLTRFIPMALLLSAIFLAAAFATLLPQIVHTNALSPDLLRYKTLESLFPNTNYALAFYSRDDLFRDYPPIRIGDEEFFYRPDLYVHLLLRGIVRTMMSLHDVSMTDSHYAAAPLAGPLAVIFYFVGFVLAVRNIREREFFLLLLWFIGGLFLLSMINTFPARQQHFVPVIPAIAIFTALGLSTCIRLLADIGRRLFSHLPLVSGRALRLGSGVAVVATGLLLGVIVFTNLRNYYVEMPEKYLPDFENIMAWDALQLQTERQFVYVYTEPSRADFVPWIIDYLPTRARYEAWSREDVVENNYDLDPGEGYTFYFPDQDLTLLDVFLNHVQAYGVAPVIETHTDREGRVLGMSVAFDVPQT